MDIENSFDIPHPPPGIKVRVHRSQKAVFLSGFRSVSPLRHNVEKSFQIIIWSVGFLTVVGGILYWLLVPILFSRHYVLDPDGNTSLSNWVVVPFLIVLLLILGSGIGYALLKAFQMTPERTDWELRLSGNEWRITRYLEQAAADGPMERNTERKILDSIYIANIGVDKSGQVYAQEVMESVSGRLTTFVALTTPLPPAEASWMEQALRPLIARAPSSM